MSIVDAKGKLIARLGGKDGPGLEPGKFIAPHGLALDSKGDIYVGEVSYTNWKTSFPDTPMPRPIRSLQKLEKVAVSLGAAHKKESASTGERGALNGAHDPTGERDGAPGHREGTPMVA